MSNIEDLTRHQIRYLCFRLQTEAEGGSKAKKESTGLMNFVDKIKDHMEDQDEFGGWEKFAKTWDVDHKSSLVTVKRTNSIQSQWNRVLKKQAKDLPESASGSKKFLTNELTQRIQMARQQTKTKDV